MKTFANREINVKKRRGFFFGNNPANGFWKSQTKLSSGKSDDKYELEADSVADKVMSRIESGGKNNESSFFGSSGFIQEKPLAEMITPMIQKQSEEEDLAAGETTPDEQYESETAGAVQTKLETANTLSVNFESTLSNSKGGGEPLSSDIKTKMESGFGGDFGDVRVHTGADAVQMSRDIGAQAFTHGNDIYFNSGEYNPDSYAGRHLLAHELTHVVQQQSTTNTSIYKQSRGEPDTEDKQESGAASCPPQSRIDELKNSYNSMITYSRILGYNVAADNLEDWLTGRRAGGTKKLSVSWLRSFSVLKSAEEKNQGRFETSLNNLANHMSNDSSIHHNDYWDALIRATGGELFYASGTSTITSTCDIYLSKANDNVSITGVVHHRWWDPYDWHAGLGAYIPGHGFIPDSDALILEQCDIARPYDMEATWDQDISGSIDVGYIWNTKNISWSAPKNEDLP